MKTDLACAPYLRKAILTGRSVLACSSREGAGGGFTLLERLVAQIGRPDAHAAVWTGPLRNLRDVSPGQWRALPPDPVRHAEAMAGHGLSERFGRLGGYANRGPGEACVSVDPRPAFDPEGGAEGLPFVTVDDEASGLPYFAWVAAARIGVASRTGGRAPLLVSPTCGDALDLFRELGMRVRVADDAILALADGETADFEDMAGTESEWWRLAQRTLPTVEQDDATGLCTVRDGTRTVFAIAAPKDARRRGETVPVARIAVLDGTGLLDGYTVVAPDRYGSLDLPEVMEIARKCARKDPMSLRGGNYERVTQTAKPVAWAFGPASVDADGVMDAAPQVMRETILAALPGGAGALPLLRAIEDRGVGRAIHAWIVQEGGHPERRADFVRTWPALSVLGMRRDVRDLVDAGASPVEALADAMGTQPWLVRRLVGVSDLPGAREDTDVRVWGWMIRFLEGLGHGLVPDAANVDGWADLRWLVSQFQHFGSRCGFLEHRAAGEFAQRLPGNGLKGRLDWLAGQGGATLQGVGDMLFAMRGWAGQVNGGRTDGFWRVTEAYAPAEMMEASERWHRHPLLSKRAHGVSADATWPVPFGPVDLGEGWQAVAIAGARDLAAEGSSGPDTDGMAGLDHCVATYAGACAEGRSLIVSLRLTDAGTTRRVSTAELAPSPSGDWTVGTARYGLVQHSGLRNARPAEEASRRLGALRARLGTGLVSIDGDALRPRKVAVLGNATAEELLPHWRTVMPRRIAGLDLQALRQLLDVPDTA
jgi:hypothetical protein